MEEQEEQDQNKETPEEPKEENKEAQEQPKESLEKPNNPQTESQLIQNEQSLIEDTNAKVPLTIEQRKQNIKQKLFSWITDNYDKTLIAILIIALIIRIWVFLQTQDQAIWWDAADYLATAKRWTGLNTNFLDMWYYRRGFFWPLFSALFFKLGLGEIGIRLSITLLSTGIVFVTYFLVKEMFNKKLALLTSIGTAFSWVFLFFSGRPLTNLPSTFFLLLSVLFFWKGYVKKQGNKFMWLFAIFFAITALTRLQYLMFTLPILVLIISKEKFRFLKNKTLWITLGIFLVVMIPFFFMYNQHFGNPILDLANYYLGIGGISESGEVGGLGGTSTLFVYFKNLPYILDGNQNGYSTLFALSPIYILFVIGFFYFFADLAFGLDKIFKNGNIQKKFFILIWIVSTFMFLGYIAPHLEQRYMMQTLPFLFLIASHTLILVENYLKTKFTKKTATILIVLILIALLIPNLIFAKNLINSKKTSYYEVKQAGEWIKANSNLEDIVVSASLPQTTYYSERPTYPFRLAYRRDLVAGNQSDFDEFVETQKPRYLIVSAFEKQEDWTFQYPQKHADILKPVKAYPEGAQQPMLVIYEFNYDNPNIPNIVIDDPNLLN